jgi:hypothetical protein
VDDVRNQQVDMPNMYFIKSKPITDKHTNKGEDKEEFSRPSNVLTQFYSVI